MLLKLKNKILLGMDRLIEDTTKKGGVPDVILLEPKEAVSFIKEVIVFKQIFKEYVSIERENDNGVDIRFLLQTPLSTEELHTLVKQWYAKEITVFYKEIEIKVTNKKAPLKPPVPARKIIAEDAYKECKICAAPLHTKFIFWDDGCTQPDCENYYKK